MNVFRELSLSIENEKAYDVYRHCMYMPTKEKYNAKVDAWLKDENIKVFAYYEKDIIIGMIVMLLQDKEKSVILGISIEPSSRGQGIGSYMIRQLMERYHLNEIVAETDDDAVDFYARNGFEVKKQVKIYNGQDVVRYYCVLNNRRENNGKNSKA